MVRPSGPSYFRSLFHDPDSQTNTSGKVTFSTYTLEQGIVDWLSRKKYKFRKAYTSGNIV